MAKSPDFDLAASHKYFSAYCFNLAWTLIEKADRTPEENLKMVALSQASIFHWTQREDCTDRNLSIGYWQASRIAAILGHAGEALRHAEVCISYSGQLPPFYLAYAHEAMARAHALAGRAEVAREHLKAAHELVASVVEEGDRKMLLGDLAFVEGSV